jgi:predicted RNA binding protein YcfA (HicA-like mRNA interferase family)
LTWERPATHRAKDASKAFQKAGWRVAGQVGNNQVLVKGSRANRSIPLHKELATRTLRSLIRAGLTVDEFLALLP